MGKFDFWIDKINVIFFSIQGVVFFVLMSCMAIIVFVCVEAGGPDPLMEHIH